MPASLELRGFLTRRRGPRRPLLSMGGMPVPCRGGVCVDGLAFVRQTGQNCNPKAARPQREPLGWPAGRPEFVGTARHAGFFCVGASRVTASSVSLETAAEPTSVSGTADPDHNPSYPRRTMCSSAPSSKRRCAACDQRLDAALQKLNVLANHAERPVFVRLYHQMQGARDQAAEAVRRLPLEVGGLYHEDHERFEQAIAAIDRIWRRWEKTGG